MAFAYTNLIKPLDQFHVHAEVTAWPYERLVDM